MTTDHGPQTGGSFRFKQPLESLHNLIHAASAGGAELEVEHGTAQLRPDAKARLEAYHNQFHAKEAA